jgi:hypothetical protein
MPTSATVKPSTAWMASSPRRVGSETSGVA